MFTGLISDVGEILDVAVTDDLHRLRIACGYPAPSIPLGASIACSGPCLTAVRGATEGGRTGFDDTTRFDIEAPWRLAPFVAEKGSVSLDGTSLTVNSVEANRFSILLIPHTLAVTTWGEVRAGSRLNLEVDQMARYAARLADPAAKEPAAA